MAAFPGRERTASAKAASASAHCFRVINAQGTHDRVRAEQNRVEQPLSSNRWWAAQLGKHVAAVPPGGGTERWTAPCSSSVKPVIDSTQAARRGRSSGSLAGISQIRVVAYPPPTTTVLPSGLNATAIFGQPSGSRATTRFVEMAALLKSRPGKPPSRSGANRLSGFVPELRRPVRAGGEE